MKPRQIAALALVGWYLIVPPLDKPHATYTSPENAPLSEWRRMPNEVFDNQQDCEAELANQRAAAEREARLNRGGLDLYSPERELFVKTARCIASDDPRLKGGI